MQAKKKRSTKWVVLTAIACVLAIVMAVALPIAQHYATVINWYLGIIPYRTVKSDTAADVVYFPSEFTKKDANGKTLLNENGKEIYDNESLAEAGRALCREVTAEGMVLLMNENDLLPLAKGTKVGLFSQSTVKLLTSGTGSGNTAATGEFTFFTSMEHAGLVPNKALWDFYSTGAGKDYKRSGPSITRPADYLINEVPWSVLQSDSSFDKMIDNEVAIFNISRVAGEGYDIPSGLANALTQSDLGSICATEDGMNGNGLTLNNDERSVLRALKEMKDQGKLRGIIVTINAANIPQFDFLKEELCGEDFGIDAAVVISTTGECGIDSLGGILTGDINPSGHLVDTICFDNTKNPAVMNFGEHQYVNYRAEYMDVVKAGESEEAFMNQMNYEVYQEGIYIGYRYYETRYEDFVMGTGNAGDYNYGDIVAFPFGHGMSYTAFGYSDFKLTDNGSSVEISVKVTNEGSVAGKEVVEVYFQSPYTDYDKQNGVEKAAVELCGYSKTQLLAPGASEVVTISVDKAELASYDSNGAKTYIMDAGEYYFTVANGAHNAVNNILAAKGYSVSSTNGRMDADGDSTLTAAWNVAELDKTTYAVSATTGAQITNQFDNADLNKYDGGSQAITYLTRNDWVGTYPTKSVELKMTDTMFRDVQIRYFPELEAVNLSEYTMPTMGASYGLPLVALRGVEFDNPMWDKLLDEMTYDDMVNLIVRGGHTTAAVNSISKPATSDQNGPTGFGTTFVGGGSGTSYPSAAMRAQTYNDALTRRVGELIGEDGLHSSISGLYGFGINTHRTPYSGRNYEYYSEDPFVAGHIGMNECQGIQSKGVIVYEKHCFLNDQETHREGVGTWSNEQAIREIYLNAFSYVLRGDLGNGHAVMTGFNRLGTVWNGDHSYINNVLRGEMGFDGFTITDADSDTAGIICVSYMYAPRAVTTGTDMYDGLYNNHDRIGQLAEFKDNAFVVSAMREACHRINYIIVNCAAMNGISSADKVIAVTPWWETALISILVGLICLTAFCAVMLVLAVRKDKNAKNDTETAAEKKPVNKKLLGIAAAVAAVAVVVILLVMLNSGSVKDFKVESNGDFTFSAANNSYLIKVYADSDVQNGKVKAGAVELGAQTANGGSGNLTCVPFGGKYAVVLFALDDNYNEKQVSVVSGFEKYGKLTAPEVYYQPGNPWLGTVNSIAVDLELAQKSEAVTSYEIETYLDEALTQKVDAGCGVITPVLEGEDYVQYFLEFTAERGNTYYFRARALADESVKAETSDWGIVSSFVAE